MFVPFFLVPSLSCYCFRFSLHVSLSLVKGRLNIKENVEAANVQRSAWNRGRVAAEREADAERKRKMIGRKQRGNVLNRTEQTVSRTRNIASVNAKARGNAVSRARAETRSVTDESDGKQRTQTGAG
ncbi:hypothetical protein R1flu_005211 [Riccia fluitans]|uniref:Secreted protein n=1 Tax=Riccia fluitans TaxID=41844 RepID=A0ABD1YVI4_9MARC